MQRQLARCDIKQAVVAGKKWKQWKKASCGGIQAVSVFKWILQERRSSKKAVAASNQG